jgi:hypothetical protein
MKKILILLLCSIVFACKKDPDTCGNTDPQDAARIEGRWMSLFPSHPEYLYSFESGLLRQSHTAFGAVISDNTYTYATRHDTLHIGGDANNLPRTLLLYFHCDSIVEARNISPGAVLAPVIWLKQTLN